MGVGVTESTTGRCRALKLYRASHSDIDDHFPSEDEATLGKATLGKTSCSPYRLLHIWALRSAYPECTLSKRWCTLGNAWHVGCCLPTVYARQTSPSCQQLVSISVVCRVYPHSAYAPMPSNGLLRLTICRSCVDCQLFSLGIHSVCWTFLYSKGVLPFAERFPSHAKHF
jgi:hypothetical protein